MEFIRVKDKVISLAFVRAIFIEEDMVVFDDGSSHPLLFAVPEAGTAPALLEIQGRKAVVSPVDREYLDKLRDRLMTEFPEITG